MASAGAELLPPTDENAISCSLVCGEPARWSLASFTPPSSTFGAPKVATVARGAGWSGASDGFLRRKGSAPIVDKQRSQQQNHDHVGLGVKTTLAVPFTRANCTRTSPRKQQRREILKAGAPANGPMLGYSTEEVPISPHFRFQMTRACARTGTATDEGSEDGAGNHSTQSLQNQRPHVKTYS